MNDRQKEVFKSYEDVNDRYCCKQVNHSLKDLYMSAREYQPHPQAQNQVATLDNVLQGLKNECRAEQTVTNDRQRYQNVGEAVDAR
jgi:hypothetical protein